mmetsp:Transcript_36891/g.86186  ORF Transcript_36891/g.86186 Transcript_36891/m.86186 type:complete len:275 (-) Transcript_36891:143-967(-)
MVHGGGLVLAIRPLPRARLVRADQPLARIDGRELEHPRRGEPGGVDGCATPRGHGRRRGPQQGRRDRRWRRARDPGAAAHVPRGHCHRAEQAVRSVRQCRPQQAPPGSDSASVRSRARPKRSDGAASEHRAARGAVDLLARAGERQCGPRRLAGHLPVGVAHRAADILRRDHASAPQRLEPRVFTGRRAFTGRRGSHQLAAGRRVEVCASRAERQPVRTALRRQRRERSRDGCEAGGGACGPGKGRSHPCAERITAALARHGAAGAGALLLEQV